MRTGVCVAAVFLYLAANGRSPVHANEVTFMGLGDLPGGDFLSTARAISGDGCVVVGTADGPDGTEAFRWTNTGGMVGLGDLTGGGFSSAAFAVSGDGSVVVGDSQSWSSDPYLEAFRWTAEYGMRGLGDFPEGRFKSIAWDVSDDGSTVIGNGTLGDIGAPRPMAYRWTQAEGMVELGDLDGAWNSRQSQAYAVSADGSTIVGSAKSTGTLHEAFRWTAEEGMIGLGDLPGGMFESGAMAVSADGSIIFGWSSAGQSEGFRWTEETGMVSLGPDGIIEDVSADGSVGIGDTSGRAYVWDEVHGQRLVRDILIANGIDMDDWTLIFGTGISADGTTIVGTGYHNGVTEAWIAHLPEPATAWLLTAAALMALRRRR
jgi:probable HAF family extracellular repeat protein